MDLIHNNIPIILPFYKIKIMNEHLDSGYWINISGQKKIVTRETSMDDTVESLDNNL